MTWIFQAFVMVFSVFLSLGVFVPHGLATIQSGSCPEVQHGLSDVRDLHWAESDRVVRMRLGNNPYSQYLQTWLEWDIFSDELTAMTLPGTVEAIQLIDRLSLQNEFFYGEDTTQLHLSPALQSAIYLSETPLPHTLYYVDLEGSAEPVELGSITGNLAVLLDVYWYSEHELVIVGEPDYGPGYQVYHVCLDGSCLVDIPEIAGTFIGRPGENVGQRQLAVFDEAAQSTFMLYDLDSKTVEAEFPLTIRLVPNLQPMWSVEDDSWYLIGFDEQYSLPTLYQLTPGTGELTAIVTLESSADDWLISPQDRFILLSTPQLQVHCY